MHMLAERRIERGRLCAAVWALLLCGPGGAAGAEEPVLRQRHALLGYASFNTAATQAPYNRDNRYAALPGRVETAEWRADFSMAGPSDCKAALALRASVSRSADPAPGSTGSTSRDLYARTGGVVCGLGDAWEVSAGRYVLGWGNATFRSPSNPFFSDTGKTDPVREQVGRDMLAMGWRGQGGWSLSAAVVGTANARTALRGVDETALLLRGEHTGATHSAGLVLSKTRHSDVFLGGYGTLTVNQALIVFGEASTQQGSEGLYPQAAPETPLGWRYVGDVEGARRSALLAGAAYTLDSGWTITVEGLYDQAGYNATQRAQALAATQAADEVLQSVPGPATLAAAQLIGQALQPGLQVQGRRHLFVQMARTEWGNRADFALRWALDTDHRAGTWSASLTWFLAPKLELLALGVVQGGGAVDGRLLRRSVLVGLRFTP